MPTITEITVYSQAGETIDQAITEAIAIAQHHACRVRLFFNDVPMEIGRDSELEKIGEGWSEIKRRQAELIGATVMQSGDVRWGRTD